MISALHITGFGGEGAPPVSRGCETHFEGVKVTPPSNYKVMSFPCGFRNGTRHIDREAETIFQQFRHALGTQELQPHCLISAHSLGCQHLFRLIMNSPKVLDSLPTIGLYAPMIEYRDHLQFFNRVQKFSESGKTRTIFGFEVGADFLKSVKSYWFDLENFLNFLKEREFPINRVALIMSDKDNVAVPDVQKLISLCSRFPDLRVKLKLDGEDHWVGFGEKQYMELRELLNEESK